MGTDEPGRSMIAPAPASQAPEAISVDNVALEGLPEAESAGPLVGREAEVATIQAALDGAVNLVFVGPPGIGKTRLMAEVAKTRCEQPGVFWYTFRSGKPALADIVLRLAAFAAQRGVAGAAAMPAAQLSSPDSARRALHQAMDVASLLCFDGVHVGRGDPDTLGFLTEIARCRHAAPVLMASREDLGWGGGIEPTCTVVALRGLDAVAARELLQGRGVEPSPEVASNLCEWTGGNPMHLHLAAAWIRARERVPESLRELVGAKPPGANIDDYLFVEVYAALTAAERSVLCAAAVLRRPVPPDALAVVSSAEDAPAATERLRRQCLLEATVTRGWQSEASQELLGVGSTLREFLLSRIPPDTATDLHGRAAEYHQSRGRRPEDALEAAHHLSSVGSWQAAVAEVRGRAELIASAGGAPDLLCLLDLAVRQPITLPDRLWCLWAQGHCYQFLGDLRQAARAFDRMLGDAGVYGEWSDIASAHIGAGTVAAAQGQPEDALKHHQQALDLAEAHDAQHMVGIQCNNLAAIHSLRGEPEAAKELFLKDLQVCEALGDPLGAAKTLSNLASTCVALGELDTAQEYAARALRVRREGGDDSGAAHTLVTMSRIASAQLDYERAAGFLDEAEAVGGRTGDAALMLGALEARVDLLIASERADEAAASARRLHTLAIETGHRTRAADAAVRLVGLLAASGAKREARVLAADVLEADALDLSATQRLALLGLGGSLAVADQEPEVAEGMLAAAAELAESLQSDERHMLTGELLLVRIGLGETQRAWDALAQLLSGSPPERFWQVLFPMLIEGVRELAADAASAQSALPRLQEAVRDSGAQLCPGLAATAHVAIGEVLVRRGDCLEAAAAYGAALRSADGVGCWSLQAAALLGAARMARRTMAHADAAELLGRALEVTRAAGDPGWLAEALADSGDLAVDAGDADRAVGAYTAALVYTQQQGDHGSRAAGIRAGLASAHGLLDDLDKCREHVAMADAILADHDWPAVRALTRQVQGNLAALDGRFDEAFGLYTEASRNAERARATRGWVTSLWARFGAAIEANRPSKEIEEALTAAARAAERTGLTGLLAGMAHQQYYALALQLCTAGRHPIVVDLLRDLAARGLATAPMLNVLASSLMEAGTHDDALAAADAACRLMPDDAICRNTRGRALLMLGRMEEAERTLREALEMDPNLTAAATNLATLYLQMGRVEEATESWERAGLQPSQLHAVAGMARRAAGDTGAAKESLRRAAEAEEATAAAAWALARFLYANGRLEEASRWARTAVDAEPGDALFRQTYAQVLQARGDAAQALEHYLQAAALAHDPQLQQESRLGMGYALGQLRRYAEAEALYRAIIADDPQCAPAHRWLGAALAEQGHHEGAADAYETATRLSPDSPDGWDGLAEQLVILGRPGEALPPLERLLALAPDEPNHVARLVGALGVQGRLDEAEEVLADHLPRFPQVGNLWHNQGVAHLARGRFEQAEECFLKAERLEPDHPHASGSVGLAQRGARYAGEARALTAMVEDQSGGSEEWLGLAEAELEIAVILQHCAPGTAAEGASRAAVHARNATLLAPGDPRAQALLGLCLQAAGQSREAEECVDRARQGNSNDLRLRRLCMRADALAGRAERAFMDLRALLKEDETLLRDMQTDVCMMPLAAVPEFRKLLSQWARQGLLDEHGIYCRVSAT